MADHKDEKLPAVGKSSLVSASASSSASGAAARHNPTPKLKMDSSGRVGRPPKKLKDTSTAPATETDIRNNLTDPQFEKVLKEVKEVMAKRAAICKKIDSTVHEIQSIAAVATKPTIRVGLFGKPGAGKSLFVNTLSDIPVTVSGYSGTNLSHGVTLYPLLVRCTDLNAPPMVHVQFISSAEFQTRYDRMIAQQQQQKQQQLQAAAASSVSSGTAMEPVFLVMKNRLIKLESDIKGTGTTNLEKPWGEFKKRFEEHFTNSAWSATAEQKQSVVSIIREVTSARILDHPIELALKMFVVSFPIDWLFHNKVEILDLSGYPDENERELRRSYIESVIQSVHVLCPFLPGRPQPKSQDFEALIECRVFESKAELPKLVFVVSAPYIVDAKKPEAQTAKERADYNERLITERETYLSGSVGNSSSSSAAAVAEQNLLHDLLHATFDVSVGVGRALGSTGSELRNWLQDKKIDPVMIDSRVKKAREMGEQSRIVILFQHPVSFKNPSNGETMLYEMPRELLKFIEERRSEIRTKQLKTASRKAFSTITEICLSVRSKSIAGDAHRLTTDKVISARSKRFDNMFTGVLNENGVFTAYLEDFVSELLDEVENDHVPLTANEFLRVWKQLISKISENLVEYLKSLIQSSIETIKDPKLKALKGPKTLTVREFLLQNCENARELVSTVVNEQLEPMRCLIPTIESGGFQERFAATVRAGSGDLKAALASPRVAVSSSPKSMDSTAARTVFSVFLRSDRDRDSKDQSDILYPHVASLAKEFMIALDRVATGIWKNFVQQNPGFDPFANYEFGDASKPVAKQLLATQAMNLVAKLNVYRESFKQFTAHK